MFVAALSNCLAQASRVVEMVALAIHGVTTKALKSNLLGDLRPLQCVYDDRRIPFHRIIGPNDDWLSGEIRIRCKSLLENIIQV